MALKTFLPAPTPLKSWVYRRKKFNLSTHPVPEYRVATGIRRRPLVNGNYERAVIFRQVIKVEI